MKEELIIAELSEQDFDKIPGWLHKDVIERMKYEALNVIVAIENDTIVSMLVVQTDSELGTVEIVDIYTEESRRRTHIAGTLLFEFIDEYNEMIDYTLNYVKAEFNEGNEDVSAFFEALGFTLIKDTSAVKSIYSLEDVKNSTIINESKGISSKFQLYSMQEIDGIRYRNMINQIALAGGNYIESFGEKMDKSLSYSLWNKDELIALVEIIDEEEQGIILGQFFMLKNDNSIFGVLNIIANKLLEKYSLDTPFITYITQESSGKLIKRILGENCKSECLVTAVLNLTQEYEAFE